MTTLVIVGGGIVGLHVASTLSDQFDDTFILEQSPYLAEHTSGRNSGVIHAGIFYEQGSFKERFCIEGNELTKNWLKKLDVAHNCCGKLIISSSENDLDSFHQKLLSLPIATPQRLTKEQTQEMEPHLKASPSIFIPSTGLVDAAAYVKAMANHLEQQGIQIIKNCVVQSVTENTITTSRDTITFDHAINAAGLSSDDIYKQLGQKSYTIKACRGDYYTTMQKIVSRPIYHVPQKQAQGLGVHITPTLDEQILIGPNAFFIDEKMDYQHKSTKQEFLESLKMDLQSTAHIKLQPGYSGNRPKLFLNDKQMRDFVFETTPNWTHLLGIESPGLTAAPAIANHIKSLL